jgi:putative flippase GtrA
MNTGGDQKRGFAALVLERLIRFASVGAVGTVAHYSVLVAAVELFGAHPTLGTAFGALVGAITNYVLNYHFTFASDEKHAVSGPKFFVIAGISLGASPGLLGLFLHVAPEVPYLVAQVAVTGCLFLVNFTLNSLWTFRRSYS